MQSVNATSPMSPVYFTLRQISDANDCCLETERSTLVAWQAETRNRAPTL
jgi:hypothetical protein